jgi:CubicO group peptidase (beta-lactamase class C family)
MCQNFADALRVCATDIGAFLKPNVLEPFEMTASGYIWNEDFEARMAWGHDAEGKLQIPRRRATAIGASRYAAAGGLHTTPSDYAKFLIEIVALKPSDAFRLNESSLREMVRSQVRARTDVDPSSWGLGWDIPDQGRGDPIDHGGDNPGFKAFAAASLSRKSGFVIMTNADNGYSVIAELMRGEGSNRLLED